MFAHTHSRLWWVCRETIDRVVERYSRTWKKQEGNYQKFR